MKWIESIQDLVQLSTQNDTENGLLKTVISKLTESEIAHIKKNTNLTVEGYNRVVDNYAVKHVLKNHGNAQTETLRGQIAVEKSDFEKISTIVTPPHSISYGGKNDTGRDTIQYVKELENIQYTLLEEVRSKRKEVALNTLYKNKKSS